MLAGKKTAAGIVGAIVALVLAFEVVKTGLPYVRDASANISELHLNTTGGATGASQLPFSGLFAANGLVLLVVMAAILLAVIGYLKLSKR